MKTAVDSISVSNKIAGTFFAILIVVGGLASISIHRADDTNALLRELVGDYVGDLTYLDTMRNAAAQYRSRLNRGIWSDDDAPAREAADASLATLEKAYRDSEAKYALGVVNLQEVRLFDHVKAAEKAFFDQGNTIRTLLHDQKPDEARTRIVKDFFPAADVLDQALLDDFTFNSQGALSDAALVAQNVQAGILNWITVLGAVILFVAAAGFFLLASIATPMRALSSAMSQLARGDTSVPIPERDRADEVGQMARTVDTLKRRLLAPDQLAGKR
jgi:methyl-accepting chemotaxis protein